jgi:hypothetical protein
MLLVIDVKPDIEQMPMCSSRPRGFGFPHPQQILLMHNTSRAGLHDRSLSLSLSPEGSSHLLPLVQLVNGLKSPLGYDLADIGISSQGPIMSLLLIHS